ncbi:swr complex subunit [Tulasnella sp. 427]|nr:swr complex subunit [Tulasnella sp. 427]
MIAMPSPYSGPSSLPAAGGRQKSGSISTAAAPKQHQAISLSSAPTVPETTFDPVHCLTQPSAPLTTSSLTSKTHKPVHFRSSLIPQPKTSLKQKINQVVQEIGVHPERLVMPTAANLEKLEALQAAAAGLLDIKKALDRVDQEIRINKARLRGGSEAADTDADGAGETDRGRTDREGSVASVEAGGGRNKRSASVVSSATSAAPDVRPRKRQRP